MSTYPQAILTTDVLYLDTKTYNANADRKMVDELIQDGVFFGFQVDANGTNMVVTVSGGKAWVKGQNITDQAYYRVGWWLGGPASITVTSNVSGNPRIDQVILRVLDNAADASGFNEARIEIVPGTPTAGATLANRLGVADLTTLQDGSKSVLWLYDILVPTGATSLSSTNLKDHRKYCSPKNCIQIGNIAGKPAASQVAQGSAWFVTDDHGGTLYESDGAAAYTQIAPSLKVVAGGITFTKTLVASSTFAQVPTCDAGTRVTLFNNNNVVSGTANDVTFKAPENGWHEYYARLDTVQPGNFGLVVAKGATRLTGRNKTEQVGNAGDAMRTDSIELFGRVNLVTTDTLSLYAYHSGGPIALQFEFHLLKIPV